MALVPSLRTVYYLPAIVRAFVVQVGEPFANIVVCTKQLAHRSLSERVGLLGRKDYMVSNLELSLGAVGLVLIFLYWKFVPRPPPSHFMRPGKRRDAALKKESKQ